MKRIFCAYSLDTYISIDVQYIYPSTTEPLMCFVKENWMFVVGVGSILVQAATSCLADWQAPPPWYVTAGMFAPAFVLVTILLSELNRRF